MSTIDRVSLIMAGLALAITVFNIYMIRKNRRLEKGLNRDE